MGEALQGKRILVVEDEYFIAADIRRTLMKAGAVVVGPVGDLPGGIALADQPLDAAILDVNLDTTMSYPIAERLQSRQIPYVFLTGYDGWALPAEHRAATRLSKPFSMQSVVPMIEGLLSPAQSERR